MEVQAPESTQKPFTETSAPRVRSGWTADTIRIARKACKLTQAELANSLGCRQQTISEWEQGMYGPKNAYQRLLDQFFSSQDGGEAKESPLGAPSGIPSTPAAAESFTVTRDQLLGAAKFMEMEGLGEMRISFRHAQDTFTMHDLETPATTRAQELLIS